MKKEVNEMKWKNVLPIYASEVYRPSGSKRILFVDFASRENKKRMAMIVKE